MAAFQVPVTQCEIWAMTTAFDTDGSGQVFRCVALRAIPADGTKIARNILKARKPRRLQEICVCDTAHSAMKTLAYTRQQKGSLTLFACARGGVTMAFLFYT